MLLTSSDGQKKSFRPGTVTRFAIRTGNNEYEIHCRLLSSTANMIGGETLQSLSGFVSAERDLMIIYDHAFF